MSIHGIGDETGIMTGVIEAEDEGSAVQDGVVFWRGIYFLFWHRSFHEALT